MRLASSYDTDIRHNVEASATPAQSEQLRRFLMLEDAVLAHQAALAIGVEGLRALAADYVAKGDARMQAAKSKYMLSQLIAADNLQQMALLKEVGDHLSSSAVCRHRLVLV